MNSPHTLAQLALEDTRKVEMRLGRMSRRFAQRVKAETIAAFAAGRQPDVAPMIVNMLRDDLRDAMLYTHLMGLKRTASRKPDASAALPMHQALSLSVFTQVLKTITKTADTRKIRELSAKYSAESLRVLIGVSRKVEDDLRTNVNTLIGEGANLRDAKRVLSERFDALGLTPKSNYQIETIFRTQSQIAYGAGKWEAGREVDDILWGYTYVTVGDDRVRPNHMELDGVTLPKDDPFWLRFWTPNGYNCRCQVIELFEETAIVQPPVDAAPDAGFGYNAGLVFTAA